MSVTCFVFVPTLTVFAINEWDSIIPNLVSGNYDTIIAGMSITAERDEVIDFTQDYFPPSPSVYMGLSGADVDVDGGVIAAQTSTIQAGYVAASGATLVEFATAEETISAVQNGEADAVLADGDYLLPIIAESGGEFAAVGEVSIGGGVGMGIRESDGELKATMNKAISSMKEDGSLNALIKKWFGADANTLRSYNLIYECEADMLSSHSLKLPLSIFLKRLVQI